MKFSLWEIAKSYFKKNKDKDFKRPDTVFLRKAKAGGINAEALSYSVLEYIDEGVKEIEEVTGTTLQVKLPKFYLYALDKGGNKKPVRFLNMFLEMEVFTSIHFLELKKYARTLVEHHKYCQKIRNTDFLTEPQHLALENQEKTWFFKSYQWWRLDGKDWVKISREEAALIEDLSTIQSNIDVVNSMAYLKLNDTTITVEWGNDVVAFGITSVDDNAIISVD